MANIANSKFKDKLQACSELLKTEFPVLSQYLGNRNLAAQLDQKLEPVPKYSNPDLKVELLLLDVTRNYSLIPILNNEEVLVLLDQILETPDSYYNDIKEAQEALAEYEHTFKPFYGLEKLRSLLFLSYEVQLKQKSH